MQCRVAPSLGALEDTPENIWGTKPYTDRSKPCVFFGLYDMRDYIALWRHKGKAYILWAGSDLLNLKRKFVLNDGKLKWMSKIPFVHKFILELIKKAENWVENGVEEDVLLEKGIVSYVCPSYLGDTNLPVAYHTGNGFNVYVSANEGREIEYGWGTVENVAYIAPKIKFHLYGSDKWKSYNPNVIVHGKVPKEQMNEEISKFQCGLRLNEFDGFSEILAKAILRGHHAVSRIYYPHITTFKNEIELLNVLSNLSTKFPSQEVRKYYKEQLNKYPWNVQNNKTI